MHRTLHRMLRSKGSATAESTMATERCTGRSDPQDAAPDAAKDAECQSPVNISKVPESHFRDRTHPVSADRTLVRVRSVAEKRDFVPNGYFLSGAYK